MVWPETIERAIAVIEEAPFLDAAAEARDPLQQRRAVSAADAGADRGASGAGAGLIGTRPR